MSEGPCVANKGAFLNHEQKFYLSGVDLIGVTNIDGGYQFNEEPINILGKGFTFSARQQPLVGNFQISKYYIGKDILLQYTGEDPISGSINYSDKTFGFESGYLNEYSLSFGIGQIPTVNASLVVYGDIGSGINASGSEEHPEVVIPNQGSIEINLDGYQTNRILDLSYTVRVNREPIYAIGSPFPVNVRRQMPMIEECSFNLEVHDYELNRIKEYLSKPKAQDLSFTFKNPITDTAIQTFSLKDAKLTNQSMQSSVDDVLKVSLTFSAYTNAR